MAIRQVYLDHSATSPVDERVLEAMLPYFSGKYGNAASVHRFGQEAEAAIETARETVAGILNCTPREIIFTSGGSESDNLALRGVAFAARQSGRGEHIVSQALEHDAIGRTLGQLDLLFGFASSVADIDGEGVVHPENLRHVMRPDTVLVSMMMANNEIGSLMPIAELAAVAHEYGAVFHTDAVQAAGQLVLDVQELAVDMLSLSAHKFYGPKGVGVLYIREGTPLLPIQTGGSHEYGVRSGTQNTPLIVGLARALELAYEERERRVQRYVALRDRLIEGVLARIPDVHLTGSREERLPSHASFVFKHVEANSLLMHLDQKGIAASSGSACKVGNPQPSDVLKALGYDNEWALGGLRLTLGRDTSEADIDYVLGVLPQAVEITRKFWMPHY